MMVMPGLTGVVALAFTGIALTGPLFAVDADRDFTGHWVLDARASSVRALGTPAEQELNVSQQDVVILCSTPGSGPKPVEWFYSLSGAGAHYNIGAESRNSMAKWEGAALLINTLVSGPQHYTVMDRWRLSRDHQTLTIVRQIVRRTGEVEGTLVYRRAETAPPAQSRPEPTPPPVEAPPPPVEAPRARVEAPRARVETPRPEPVRPEPALPRPAGPPEPSELAVPAGTRIPLELRNTVDVKHAREGDRVYLRTSRQIAIDGWIVIPSGSFVNGVLSRPASKGKEVYIVLNTLVLPNGVSRDFHGGAPPAPLLLSRRPDVPVAEGTSIDFILDRELRYSADELRRPSRY